MIVVVTSLFSLLRGLMLLLECRINLQHLEDDLAGFVEGSTSVAVSLICTHLLDGVVGPEIHCWLGHYCWLGKWLQG